MNVQSKLKLLCKKIALPYKSELYKQLICKRDLIIIDNYVTGCPAQEYSKYKNDTSENRIKNITKFIHSEDFKSELKSPKGAKTNKKDSSWKISIIKKSALDPNLKIRMVKFYNKVSLLDKEYGISIVDKENAKNKEVCLHEFIHIFLESNKIRHSSWKWNEGLVTYLTSYALNKEKNHEKNPQKNKFKSNFYYNYVLYAHKWHVSLKELVKPEDRLKNIKIKIAET